MNDTTAKTKSALKPGMARALIAGALMLSAATGWAQERLKIGFLGELSGPAAGVGQDQLDGFNLLLERNGGKLGGVPVTLVKEDSQLKPEVANQAVRRLIEKENVPIITGVSFSNGSTRPLARSRATSATRRLSWRR